MSLIGINWTGAGILVHRASVAVVLACFFVSGCSKEDTSRPFPAAGSPNVILIVVDTLRADRLGCYGGKGGLTPNIDAFAAQGCFFLNAFSHAPWTLPASASLLTSLYPSQHGAGKGRGDPYDFEFEGIRPEAGMIAEGFLAAGYSTAAIASVIFLSPKYGFNRGFETYEYRPPQSEQTVSRRADETTDWAIEWLKGRSGLKRPFFLMVHYFDPHLTYDPPPAFRERFAQPEDRVRDPRLFGTALDMMRLRQGRIDPKSLPMARLESLYNGEVAFTDQQIGRLLSQIKQSGLEDHTIVALTADHGEEFLDHGGFEHGHTLYDELLHIPLVIRYPGVLAPTRVSATIGHRDIAPTLCRLAGVSPSPTFQGKNLESVIYRREEDDRELLSQGNMWGQTLTCLRYKGYKLIEKPDGVEMYHVETDPREKIDISKIEGAKAMRLEMSQRLELAKKAMGPVRSGQAVPNSLAERETLKALGYVSSREDSPKENQQPAATTRAADHGG